MVQTAFPDTHSPEGDEAYCSINVPQEAERARRRLEVLRYLQRTGRVYDPKQMADLTVG